MITGALTCLKLVLKYPNTSSALNVDLTIIYAKWREGRKLPDEIELPDRRVLALTPKKSPNAVSAGMRNPKNLLVVATAGGYSYL